MREANRREPGFSGDGMKKRLYVGGLAYSVTDIQLQKMFEQHGAVSSARISCERATGRSRGFGFVEMVSEKDARTAVEALNRTQLEGDILIVTTFWDLVGLPPEQTCPVKGSGKKTG